MDERIIKIIAENLEMDEALLKDRLDDREVWDSLRRVEIVFQMEETFDIMLSEEELAEADTPRKLMEIVKKETA